MVGLPQGYCGFKLINSKKTDPENWIFSVTTTKTVMETPFRVLHYGTYSIINRISKNVHSFRFMNRMIKNEIEINSTV